MPLDPASLDFIRRLVEERTGVVLDNKDYLIESRLESLAITSHFKSASELVARLRSTRERQLEHEVVETLLTHETMFFRDKDYFDCIIRRLLPQLLADRHHVRVWCAACSTGQEPYSLAMLLRERLPSQQARVQILASDYARHSLQQARDGSYSRAEVNRGLSPTQLSKYFTQVDSRWRLDGSLVRAVDFREINLHAAWPALGRFELILLRNVLIYMPHKERTCIVQKAIQSLEPGGYMVLGASESLRGVSTDVSMITHGHVTVYQRPA